MQVIDSKLASCYYDVSIIPYWTYEVQIVVRVAIWRGNQVQVLSDPVTVTEERLFNIPLYDSMRRGRGAMILKSGNLLCMARLNFRVKCNNQLGDIRNPGALSADWKQAFFYGIRLFVWIIPMCLWFCHHRPEPFRGMIKWQAVLLRMHSFPPHIMNGFIVYPGAVSQILRIWIKDDQFGRAVTGFFYVKGESKWRNRIGKENIMLFSVIKNVNIFRVMQELIRRTLTVCFVTVRCMRWEINAAGISEWPRRELKTARTVSCRTKHRTTGT